MKGLNVLAYVHFKHQLKIWLPLRSRPQHLFRWQVKNVKIDDGGIHKYIKNLNAVQLFLDFQLSYYIINLLRFSVSFI